MNELKLSGIILSSVPMGDKDLRCVLLSRETGKVTVLVKGGLLPNAKWRSVAQPFCCGNFVLNKGNTFYYIKEAELGDSLYEIRSDLDRFAWASLVLEAGERFSLDGVENRSLVNLMARGLIAIARSGFKPELCASAFILRLLAEAGLQGQWDVCHYCGKEPDFTEAWGFRPEDGALVCPVCEKLHGTGYLLSPETIKWWKNVQEADERTVFAVSAPEEAVTEIRRAAVAYLQFQSEEKFRSLDFIRSMGY